MRAVEVQILGPFVVRVDDRNVPLTAAKQRALVAMLAMRAGHPVSRDELIDALWGEQLPDSVDSGLNVLVSRVRRAFGDAADVIERRAGGYVLALQEDGLDSARFEALYERGRLALSAGEVGRARGLLREALELWHGRAFADLADQEFTRSEAQRLEALRAVALEHRIEADLAAGEVASLVPELEALVAGDPLRERLHELLMLALYRSGRQADALAHYRTVHRLLDAELGIEPGPDLRRLHEAMLHQAPELEPPRRPAPPPEPARTPVRRRAMLAAAAAALATALAGLALRNEDEPSRAAFVVPVVELPANALAELDPMTGVRRSVRRVGAEPTDVAAGETGVWVIGGPTPWLVHVDPGSGKVAHPARLRAAGTDVLAAGNAVWISTHTPPAVLRIDAEAPGQDRRIPAGLDGTGPAALAKGDGAIFTARRGGDLERISPSAMRVTARVPLTATGSGFAIVAGIAWVPTSSPRGVARIPLRGGPIGRLELEYEVAEVAAGGGAVWAAAPSDDRVLRIDPITASVTHSVPAGDGVSLVAAWGSGVWAASPSARTLYRIDARTARVTRRVRLTAAPRSIAFGPTALWVVTGSS